MGDVTRSAAERGGGPAPTPDRRLGDVLRGLRRERGLTLVQVAAATGLSQPFLSQLELGRSRPSMRSLFRIAAALGTTQQALLALAAVEGTAGRPAAHRAADGATGETGTGGAGADGADEVAVGDEADGSPGARLLHHGDGADVTEFALTPAPFADFYAHDRHELLYVVRGVVELEMAGQPPVLLRCRESTGYPGRTPHRFRQVGAEPAVVLVVHSPGTTVEAGADAGPARTGVGVAAGSGPTGTAAVGDTVGGGTVGGGTVGVGHRDDSHRDDDGTDDGHTDDDGVAGRVGNAAEVRGVG